MKWFTILLMLLPGCYYLGQNSYQDIVVEPSSDWSGPEQLTVIMEAGNNNLRDGRTNVKAIATPYYPSVVKSIGRRAQIEHHWSEIEFRGYVDRLLRDASAMYVDWDKPNEQVYDSRLQPLVSPLQFDSLLILLTLRNNAWPCGKYIVLTVGTRFINVPLDAPDCMPPDITNLEEKLFLVNGQNTFIAPITVWGRKMNYLTNNEETLFLKFRLREGGSPFLRKHAAIFSGDQGPGGGHQAGVINHTHELDRTAQITNLISVLSQETYQNTL